MGKLEGGETNLVVVETHPVQHHASIYRAVQSQFGIPVTAVYGADFSAAGYLDPEFGVAFSWDTDLLAGYSHLFLSRIADGGAGRPADITGQGLTRALRGAHPAAILIPGHRHRFYRRAALVALRRHMPMMLRAETIGNGPQRSPRRLVRDAYLRVVYAGCDAFLYIGERARRHYERFGIEADQLFFSPYSADPTPFSTSEEERAQLRPLTRRALRIGENALVLLFSGKLVARKEPVRIAEAVRALNRPFGEIVVVYVGEGLLHEQIAQCATFDPPVDVRFVGLRNQRELSGYYHAADMLVLPSRRDEPWGVVVNEALHHGVPCVVSDAVGCADDLVEPGETGFVFKAGDTDALARAIAQCGAIAGTTDVRARCRNLVAGYSIEAAARGIAGAFESTIHART